MKLQLLRNIQMQRAYDKSLFLQNYSIKPV